MLPFKTRRTSQPQGAVEIDWMNPLANGLVYAVLPAISSKNLCGSGSITKEAGSVVRAYKNGLHTSQHYLTSDIKPTFSTQVTCLWFGTITSVGDTSQLLTKRTAWSATGIPFALSVHSDYFSFGVVGNTATLFSDNFTYGSGPIAIAGSWDGSTKRIFVNGIVRGSQSFSGTVTNNSEGIAMGALPSLGEPLYGGSHMAGLVFNVYKSPAEIKSISDNPWQLFKPHSRSLWIPGTVTSGGAATVIPIGQQATGSVGTLVATGAAKCLPAGVSASSTVGTPVAVGGSSIPATVTPAGVSATGSVGTVTATGQTKAYPSGVSATASVGSPVALAGGAAVATPAGVQAVGAVGNLIATGAAWVVPGGVSASGAVGTPVASGGAAVAAVAYPVGLVGYWSVGTPTINTTGIETVSGAATRQSRLQVSNRAPRYQTGARHAR